MDNTVGITNSRVITLRVIADTRFDLPRGRKPPSAESGKRRGSHQLGLSKR
jgi:hypothetical protein